MAAAPRLPKWLTRHLPNGMVRIALGVLIAFGFAFVVRRLLVRRERKRAAIAARRPAPALAGGDAGAGVGEAIPALATAEPTPLPLVAPPMDRIDTNDAAHSADGGPYPLLARPHVHLSGPVDQAMYRSFREQLAQAPASGALVIALSTLGGDPEIARLMGDEVRLMRDYGGRELLFLGKVAVYSAGATFMAAFPADKRFLTRGTRVMVHERILTKTVELSGPLRTLTATLRANLHEIEHSIAIEEEGFRDLVAGTRIDFDALRARAPDNWYIEADEARELGLVLDVI